MDPILIISLYVTFMAGLFTAFLYKLNKISNVETCINDLSDESTDLSYKVDLEDLDSYLVRKVRDFCSLHNIMNQDIIVGITGDIQSMSLVSILKYLYPENNIHVVFVNHYFDHENNSELSYFLDDFCKDNDLIYHSFQYKEDRNIMEINKTNHIRDFIYDCYKKKSAELNITTVFQANDMSNTYNNIFDAMLSGKDFNDVSLSVYNEANNLAVSFYRPFYNVNTEEIENFRDTFAIAYDYDDSHKMFKQQKKYTIFNEVAPLLDYTYPEWKRQLLLLHHEKIGYENALDIKIEPIYSSFKYYTFGLIFNMPNDYIPFKIWKKLLNKSLSTFGIIPDNVTIEKIYFVCNTSDSVIQGDLTERWRFYYSNMRLIIYNHEKLQEIFESDVVNNETTNTLEDFLEGKLSYTCLETYDKAPYVTVGDDFIIGTTNIPIELLANFKFLNNNKSEPYVEIPEID